ncbi:MAG: folate-binding protein YgfZ [Deltaproteobacteria bacterium]|nr:folate-binding protein YgfZ [Deltaproteobacteria bacterium]
MSQVASSGRQAEAARDAVLVVRSRARSAIVVTGKDRISWLNGLVTCDLAKRGPHEAAYGLLVEKKGRIQTDLVVVPSAAAVALAVPVDLRDALLETFDHYLIMEDAELTTPDLVFFFAHGPKAEALAGHAPFSGSLDLMGHGGLVLAVPAAEADALEARLAADVAARGGAMGDEATFAVLAIERGLPRFREEFDTTHYPQEAGIEKIAVSFQKGCYLGQEVVYMLENRGHAKKKLVPLDLDGDVAPEVGAAVTTATGESIGEIKSSALAPLTTKPVAIAMVKWAHAKPGTELRVGDRAATVRAFP